MIMPHASTAVFLYPDNFPGPEIGAIARRIERRGYAASRYPEVFHDESDTLGGYLLSQTERTAVAAGIANIYGRDPMAAVQGGRGPEPFYRGRFVAGLGVSHTSLVADTRGHEYSKPLTTMRRCLADMERAKAHRLGADPPLVRGALGWEMIELAGEMSDGTHPFNSPLEHTRQARNALELYSITPNHQPNWLRIRYPADGLENGGSDRLIDPLAAWGGESRIRNRIQQRFDTGATEVIVNANQPRAATTLPKVTAAGVNWPSSPDWATLEAPAR